MKTIRTIVEIDEEKCDGCGLCVPACAEGAIKIENGKARLMEDRYCDGLGACLGECPQDAIRIIEREADEFDEEAVEELLKSRDEEKKQPFPEAPNLACGCPSSQMMSFAAAPGSCAEANKPAVQVETKSELTHWPVQIRLVPPTAPFLDNADLLVAADCTPLAYGNFHQDFLKDKVVLMGCPKFDDAQSYVEKFADIFRKSAIRSVTVAIMEVPCCQGLPRIVKAGMEQAGVTIPLEVAVITRQGERAPAIQL